MSSSSSSSSSPIEITGESAAPTQKRLREKRIGTHSGSFHADEALACWLLRQTEEFSGASVVRSRDPEVLKELDILVDVGGKYDPSRYLFDHHQREFHDTFSEEETIRLSSAGLVYKHFGKEIVAKLGNLKNNNNNNNNGSSSTSGSEAETQAKIDLAWKKIYSSFIKPLDAIDNGITQVDSEQTPRYRISTDLSSRVGSLNPAWYEDNSDEKIDSQFAKAMELTGSEFTEAVRSFCADWFLSRDVLRGAIAAEGGLCGPDSQILVLPRSCPWKAHLFDWENEQGSFGRTKYVLFPDSAIWRIQAVPKNLSTFGDRLSLPPPWRGLRDQTLSDLIDLPGSVFVHASGFIGGHQTKEGVFQMALKALEFYSSSSSSSSSS